MGGLSSTFLLGEGGGVRKKTGTTLCAFQVHLEAAKRMELGPADWALSGGARSKDVQGDAVSAPPVCVPTCDSTLHFTALVAKVAKFWAVRGQYIWNGLAIVGE